MFGLLVSMIVGSTFIESCERQQDAHTIKKIELAKMLLDIPGVYDVEDGSHGGLQFKVRGHGQFNIIEYGDGWKLGDMSESAIMNVIECISRSSRDVHRYDRRQQRNNHDQEFRR